MPFAQPFPVGPEDEGDVRELRRRCLEGMVKEHLLGRVRDVIVAAHDVGNGHVDIVHHDAEVMDTDNWMGLVLLAFVGLLALGVVRGCTNDLQETGMRMRVLDDCIKSGRTPLECKEVR